MEARESILTINGGSSSIKFASYNREASQECRFTGSVERLGDSASRLSYSTNGGAKQRESFDGSTAVAKRLIDWFDAHIDFKDIKAIGHRVVHGLHHTEPQFVTPELLADLRRICSFDPDHLPREIELIEELGRRYPSIPQVACFDTAFHATMPRVAKLLAVPRRFDAMGLQRYGFHGLSYAYLIEELERTAGVEASQGRVILAHLGSGASLAAVRGGKSIDTSMGFTPAGGIPMGTRPGDLDPGAAWYMMDAEKLNANAFQHLIHHESGLLGVSETSSDMRDLTQRAAQDIRAAEAVELFCYQTRKWIGAFAAALHGLDTLVFAGGIGENAPDIRARICDGLQFLGIEIDRAQNAANHDLISTASSRISVRMIRTDEGRMIARHTSRLLEKDTNHA